MKSTSTRPVVVESGGNQVASFAGLHSVGSFADGIGLGEALSGAIAWKGNGVPVHDRGKVLVHQMLSLLGGGEAVSDIEFLRAEEDLFKKVCSDSTLYRTFTKSLDPFTMKDVLEAFGGVRRKVWEKAGFDKGNNPIILDIDATLVQVHSENKEETAPKYKKGFGYHPMFVTTAKTGEVLSSELRPGNAGANDIDDHVALVDLALDQLPDSIALGHRLKDSVEPTRDIIIRADSAGCSTTFAASMRRRRIHFAVSSKVNDQVRRAVSEAAENEELWRHSIDGDGTTRNGSSVCEITESVNLKVWPQGTRLIIRREPLHPGARTTLFPHLDYRFVGFYTDLAGDPVELDLLMRERTSIEDAIGRLKDLGLNRFPFNDFSANAAWMKTVTFSHDLMRWFQLTCLKGRLRTAEPKTLRFRLFSMPARKIRSGRRIILKLLSTWPEAESLIAAHRRIALLI